MIPLYEKSESNGVAKRKRRHSCFLPVWVRGDGTKRWKTLCSSLFVGDSSAYPQRLWQTLWISCGCSLKMSSTAAVIHRMAGNYAAMYE